MPCPATSLNVYEPAGAGAPASVSPSQEMWTPLSRVAVPATVRTTWPAALVAVKVTTSEVTAPAPNVKLPPSPNRWLVVEIDGATRPPPIAATVALRRDGNVASPALPG